MTGENRTDTAVEFHSHNVDYFANYYDQLNAKPYGASFIYTRRRLDHLLSRLLPEQGNGMRFLDLGCGTGRYMVDLAKRGFNVVGVDGSEEMLSVARANNPEAEFHQGSVEDIPLPDASVDYILCVEVLRYLPDYRRCVHEMGRVLKPGGVCFVTATPLFNANGYWLVNRAANLVRVGSISQLKQYFVTSPGIRRTFRDAGFERPDVHGVYTGPINWVERLTPWFFPTALKLWEPFDKALADKPLLREVSNLFLVRAVKGQPR